MAAELCYLLAYSPDLDPIQMGILEAEIRGTERHGTRRQGGDETDRQAHQTLCQTSAPTTFDMPDTRA
ncbi:hypothetical protein ACVIHI_000091 [Bradyrhizobium sp. USDA 4524]|uniref:hypothetical protein n=1 Tax=unclassified Bradyrhizobium TaxID=2631580 RepID=UPI0020A17896|nr:MULTISPECIES: hypothetical protein [unclassified Bradyrhizobium]MCP1838544.1 hypothetical protein [Bradyrhizobium sp. USDA 4538]MCP1986778.1 hypothetical protein [Bradyrhizobium sp. USDA 4539]